MSTATVVDAVHFMRDSAVTAATAAGDRVFPSIAPQNKVYPLVILEVISREESPTQDSGSAVDTFRIEVNAFAKATSAKSAFTIAHEISQAIREQVSRAADGVNYDNNIDSVQEADLRTDYLSDLDVYQVTTDYMVRVIANSSGPIRINVPETDTAEQVYTLRRWINGELIYWQTWYFAAGNDALNTLTGLDPDDVQLITPMCEMVSTTGTDQNTAGVGVETSGGAYKVFLASDQTEIYITLYYVKI